jgi:hypothetical protein
MMMIIILTSFWNMKIATNLNKKLPEATSVCDTIEDFNAECGSRICF